MATRGMYATLSITGGGGQLRALVMHLQVPQGLRLGGRFCPRPVLGAPAMPPLLFYDGSVRDAGVAASGGVDLFREGSRGRGVRGAEGGGEEGRGAGQRRSRRHGMSPGRGHGIHGGVLWAGRANASKRCCWSQGNARRTLAWDRVKVLGGRWRVGGKAHDHGGGAGLVGGGAANGAAGPGGRIPRRVGHE